MGRLCSSTKSVPCPTNNCRPTNNRRTNTRSTNTQNPSTRSQLAASDGNEDGDGDVSDVESDFNRDSTSEPTSESDSDLESRLPKKRKKQNPPEAPRHEVRVNSGGSQTTVIHLPHPLAEVEQEARGLVEDTVNQPDYSGLEVITGDVLFLTLDGKTLGRKKTATVGTISIIASCFKQVRRVSANKRHEVSSTPIPSRTDTYHSGICLVLVLQDGDVQVEPLEGRQDGNNVSEANIIGNLQALSDDSYYPRVRRSIRSALQPPCPRRSLKQRLQALSCLLAHSLR
jgi:hypothetical protein